MGMKNKKSEYRKYREGLWLPYRYVLYSYWYQFLKIAYQENRGINWKKYEDWGTPEELFSQSFRTWWEKNWKRLFAVKDAYSEEGKFLMSTRYPKETAIKVALEVYKLKTGYKKLKGHNNHTEKMVLRILDRKYRTLASELIEKEQQKLNPRLLSKMENEIIFDLLKLYYPDKMGSISGKGDGGTREINRTIKRYKTQAEKILQNVCEGQFP